LDIRHSSCQHQRITNNLTLFQTVCKSSSTCVVQYTKSSTCTEHNKSKSMVCWQATHQAHQLKSSRPLTTPLHAVFYWHLNVLHPPGRMPGRLLCVGWDCCAWRTSLTPCWSWFKCECGVCLPQGSLCLRCFISVCVQSQWPTVGPLLRTLNCWGSLMASLGHIIFDTPS
jgi:hypothetical protein